MSHTNSTTNYGLPQFLSSDKPAWMADINVAMSDIDAQMKLNADAASTANTDIGTIALNFASGYSNMSTYDVGDVVVYDKRMYVCDVAVTVPEAFDNAKWSYYRVSDASDALANVIAAENAVETLVGNTDISTIGNGTCTGAIDSINANLPENWTSGAVTETESSVYTASGTFTTTSDCLITAYLSAYSTTGSAEITCNGIKLAMLRIDSNAPFTQYLLLGHFKNGTTLNVNISGGATAKFYTYTR